MSKDCHGRESPNHAPTASLGSPPESPIRDRAPWLVTDCWDTLVLHARQKLGEDSGLAEDVAAEAVARFACGAFDEIEIPPGRTLAFALGVVRKLALNLKRRECKLLLTRQEPEAPVSVDAIDPILQSRIDRAMRVPSRSERDVIGLHYLESWTVAEIATARGVSPKTVKELLRRGRRKLKVELQSTWDNGR